jgi:hypothetical protein
MHGPLATAFDARESPVLKADLAPDDALIKGCDPRADAPIASHGRVEEIENFRRTRDDETLANRRDPGHGAQELQLEGLSGGRRVRHHAAAPERAARTSRTW